MTRVVVRDVSFTYPRARRPVLEGVSFDLGPGSSAAIIGPSGSGKTTLLALMGGLLRGHSGSVAAVDPAGRESALPPLASWILQTVSLFPERTALDNAMVGAFSETGDLTTARRRAEAALTAVGLADHLTTPARLLSGGEAQRVAIARALASQRAIILADEPTGQLDAVASARVVEAIVGARGARTVIIVTHDPDVARRCDVVLEFLDGGLQERAS